MSDANPEHHLACAITDSTSRNDSSLKAFSTVFTNEKAGMQHVDKEKVKRVVYDMSKDSVHHENELRKLGKVAERVSIMKSIQSGLRGCALQQREQEMQPLLAHLEAQRDLSQVWLHVDMDAFYAACEERDNPELKSIPVAIGGMSMISTANYEARKYGVRAAMPGFIAIKLCPHLKFIKLDFRKYEQAAAQAREVFARFDPSYFARGLDEASLCITNHCTENGETPAQVAEQIRKQVLATTGLTCSCGTAPNTMLAKICSDLRKPNGQFHIDCTRDAVMDFIESLSVRKVSEQLLNEFGVLVVSDLYRHRGLLSHLFSSISMNFFMHVALGLGSTQHQDLSHGHAEERKSISHERTFATLENADDLQVKIVELANKVSQDLQEAGMCGKCITLKLKQTDFRVRQRSTTLPTCIDSSEGISAAAKKLLSYELPIKVRLIGVKVSSLQDSSSTTRLDAFLRTARNDDSNRIEDTHVVCRADGQQQNLSEYNHQRANPNNAQLPVLHEHPCALPLVADVLNCRSTHELMACLDSQQTKSNSLLCNECGASVPSCEMQEHKDMHVAVALSRKMNGPGYLAPQPKRMEIAVDRPCGPKRKDDHAKPNQTRQVGNKRSKVSKATSTIGRIDSFLARKTGKG